MKKQTIVFGKKSVVEFEKSNTKETIRIIQKPRLVISIFKYFTISEKINKDLKFNQ